MTLPERSDFAAREAALDHINDDPAWAQRAYGAPGSEQSDIGCRSDATCRTEATPDVASLSEREIKALLWATAPYSTVSEVHESSILADSIALIQSARIKLRGRCS